MRSSASVGAVLLSFIAATASGISFNPDDDNSIRDVTKQYAYDLMSLYKNNATGVNPQDVGTWPKPYYWWEGGAAWGGMIEYTQITGDNSHVKTLQQALTANYGDAKNFILPYRHQETGNDDQAFWALAAMSAVEFGFPEPDNAPASYLQVAINTFNDITSRWDESSCGGGFKWQIYPDNAYGYDYKNSISAACVFDLGARLARYTGEQKYADWANKVYDWTKKTGLISDQFEVFDGTDDKSNCATVSDKTQWSYNSALFMHGSAVMYDYKNGDKTWGDRANGFLQHAQSIYFKPYDNATDVMFEWACETGESGRHCNLDQQSFKAYLGRFMAKTALLVPSTKDGITKSLKASAVGAAKSCSGGANKATCGSKWYTGNNDGAGGVGQQLSALEVTQNLLMIKKGTMPQKANSKDQQAAQSTPPKQNVATPAVSSSAKPINSVVVISAIPASRTMTPLLPLGGVCTPRTTTVYVDATPTPAPVCKPSTTTVYVDATPSPSKPTTSCTPTRTTTLYVAPKPTNGTLPVYNVTAGLPPTFTGAATKLGMTSYATAGVGTGLLALFAAFL